MHSDLKTGEADDKSTDSSTGHCHGDITIGRAHNLGKRSAITNKPNVAVDVTLGRVEEARPAKEGRKVDVLNAQICLGDWIIHSRVDRQLANDLAATPGHVQRPHERLATRDLHAGCDRLHRKVGGCDHAFRIESHIHVHRAQPLDMERHVGEELSSGLQLRCRLPLLSGDVAALTRCRADQRSKVGKCQMLRDKPRRELRRLGALVDGKIAGEIAVAGMPGHVVQAPDAWFACNCPVMR